MHADTHTCAQDEQFISDTGLELSECSPSGFVVQSSLSHRTDTLTSIEFSSLFFAENEGNDVESRSVIWIQRGKSVCVIVHAHVHVCAHAHVCTWECSPSWPADSLPSEILSEDYKTNQQTVIAAASL